MLFNDQLIDDINSVLDEIDRQLLGSQWPVIFIQFTPESKWRLENAVLKLKQRGAIRIGSESSAVGSNGGTGSWQIEVSDLYSNVAEHYRRQRGAEIHITPSSYDGKSQVLSIATTKIQFRGNQADLLGVLLKNEKSIVRLWNNDEVLERLEPNTEITKQLVRSVLDAGISVNKRVTISTQGKVIDLLLATSKTVQVNSKYL